MSGGDSLLVEDVQRGLASRTAIGRHLVGLIREMITFNVSAVLG